MRIIKWDRHGKTVTAVCNGAEIARIIQGEPSSLGSFSVERWNTYRKKWERMGWRHTLVDAKQAIVERLERLPDPNRDHSKIVIRRR